VLQGELLPAVKRRLQREDALAILDRLHSSGGKALAYKNTQQKKG